MEKSLKVLVVDDDPSIAEVLAELLMENGHKVCGVESTEDGAVAAAARCRPDLVIIDVRLGSGSGVSAVNRMSVLEPLAHVLITGTAFGTHGSVLRKPFREADLLRAMALALPSAFNGA